MAKRTPQDKGKAFESECIEFLKGMMVQRRCATHRLYDTHSAGALLPPQPGDCFHVHDGKLFLFEFKSSGEYDTLAGSRGPLNSLFSADQIALMRIWHRAGAITTVVFKSQVNGIIQAWDGNYIAGKYVGGRTDVAFSTEDRRFKSDSRIEVLLKHVIADALGYW